MNSADQNEKNSKEEFYNMNGVLADCTEDFILFDCLWKNEDYEMDRIRKLILIHRRYKRSDHCDCFVFLKWKHPLSCETSNHAAAAGIHHPARNDSDRNWADRHRLVQARAAK